jgi:Mn2+/Fe2+ NRAMP family transporter
VAAPIMAVLMLMASDRRVMGKFTVSPSLKLIGWFATGTMLLIAAGVFATLK